MMGQRTLVVQPRADGCVVVRVAQWGVDADPVAQSRPLGADWTPREVWDELDATYDRVVVVDGAVETYCVCWLDPTLSDLSDVVLASASDPDALRAWWVDTKSSACVDLARRSPGTVRAGLARALARRAHTVSPHDDTPFLRTDR